MAIQMGNILIKTIYIYIKPLKQWNFQVPRNPFFFGWGFVESHGNYIYHCLPGITVMTSKGSMRCWLCSDIVWLLVMYGEIYRYYYVLLNKSP